MALIVLADADCRLPIADCRLRAVNADGGPAAAATAVTDLRRVYTLIGLDVVLTACVPSNAAGLIAAALCVLGR